MLCLVAPLQANEMLGDSRIILTSASRLPVPPRQISPTPLPIEDQLKDGHQVKSSPISDGTSSSPRSATSWHCPRSRRIKVSIPGFRPRSPTAYGAMLLAILLLILLRAPCPHPSSRVATASPLSHGSTTTHR